MKTYIFFFVALTQCCVCVGKKEFKKYTIYYEITPTSDQRKQKNMECYRFITVSQLKYTLESIHEKCTLQSISLESYDKDNHELRFQYGEDWEKKDNKRIDELWNNFDEKAQVVIEIE